VQVLIREKVEVRKFLRTTTKFGKIIAARD